MTQPETLKDWQLKRSMPRVWDLLSKRHPSLRRISAPYNKATGELSEEAYAAYQAIKAGGERAKPSITPGQKRRPLTGQGYSLPVPQVTGPPLGVTPPPTGVPAPAPLPAASSTQPMVGTGTPFHGPLAAFEKERFAPDPPRPADPNLVQRNIIPAMKAVSGPLGRYSGLDLAGRGLGIAGGPAGKALDAIKAAGAPARGRMATGDFSTQFRAALGGPFAPVGFWLDKALQNPAVKKRLLLKEEEAKKSGYADGTTRRSRLGAAWNEAAEAGEISLADRALADLLTDPLTYAATGTFANLLRLPQLAGKLKKFGAGLGVLGKGAETALPPLPPINFPPDLAARQLARKAGEAAIRGPEAALAKIPQVDQPPGLSPVDFPPADTVARQLASEAGGAAIRGPAPFPRMLQAPPEALETVTTTGAEGWLDNLLLGKIEIAYPAPRGKRANITNTVKGTFKRLWDDEAALVSPVAQATKAAVARERTVEELLEAGGRIPQEVSFHIGLRRTEGANNLDYSQEIIRVRNRVDSQIRQFGDGPVPERLFSSIDEGLNIDVPSTLREASSVLTQESEKVARLGQSKLREADELLDQAKADQIQRGIDAIGLTDAPAAVRAVGLTSGEAAELARLKKLFALEEGRVTVGIKALDDIIDKGGPKATVIKRLENLLGKDPNNIYTDEFIEGFDEIEGLIDQYKDIERAGITPEEFNDEKLNAFEELVDHIQQALEPVERELEGIGEDLAERATKAAAAAQEVAGESLGWQTAGAMDINERAAAINYIEKATTLTRDQIDDIVRQGPGGGAGRFRPTRAPGGPQPAVVEEAVEEVAEEAPARVIDDLIEKVIGDVPEGVLGAVRPAVQIGDTVIIPGLGEGTTGKIVGKGIREIEGVSEPYILVQYKTPSGIKQKFLSEEALSLPADVPEGIGKTADDVPSVQGAPDDMFGLGKVPDPGVSTGGRFINFLKKPFNWGTQ